MSKFTRDVVVACPPSHVFGVLSNVERLPEFSHLTVAIRNGPGRVIEVGDRFEQSVRVLGIEFDTDWEVTEVVADTTIRVEGRSQHSGKASLTQNVAPEGTGSRVTFEVDYDPPFGILGDIADKVVFERKNEEDAEHILARLKELCEGTPAS
jgi:uncharacterized membrane protein